MFSFAFIFYFRAAKGRKKDYEYYIFSDGDIKLLESRFKYQKGVTKKFEHIRDSGKNNFLKFENFLLDYGPAIGSVENQFLHSHHFAAYQFPIDDRLYFLNFDAQFNGFHHSVLDDLLPYDNRDQRYSVWNSQVIMQCNSFLRYHGHAISFMPIYATNYAHSEYPRGRPPGYGTLCKEEIDKAPLKFRDSPLIKKVMIHTIYSLKNSFKYMAKPKADIVKYSDYSLSIMNKNSQDFS